jgi:hypothetical protein
MGKFLSWLQERIKHWIKPATPVLIIGILSDITRSQADNENLLWEACAFCKIKLDERSLA